MEQTLEQLETCVVTCRKRALAIDFVYTRTEPLPGGQRKTDIKGTATLPIVATGEGYEGVGQATYDYESSSVDGCRREQETVKGTLTMEAKAYFSTDNNRVGGLAIGNRPRTVLEILTTTGALAGKGTRTEVDCRTVTPTSTSSSEFLFDCHFYDVDLKAGGYFVRDKDRVSTGGKCSVTITPQP